MLLENILTLRTFLLFRIIFRNKDLVIQVKSLNYNFKELFIIFIPFWVSVHSILSKFSNNLIKEAILFQSKDLFKFTIKLRQKFLFLILQTKSKNNNKKKEESRKKSKGKTLLLELGWKSYKLTFYKMTLWQCFNNSTKISQENLIFMNLTNFWWALVSKNSKTER